MFPSGFIFLEVETSFVDGFSLDSLSLSTVFLSGGSYLEVKKKSPLKEQARNKGCEQNSFNVWR